MITMRTVLALLGLLVLLSTPAHAQILTWNYPVDAVINGFLVERAPTVAGTCQTFAQIAATGVVSTYTDNTALAPGASFCYRLLAFQGTPTARVLESPYSNTATYIKPLPAPTLTVKTASIQPGAQGSVVSNPAGIDCGRSGGACQATFDFMELVTLVAYPHSNSRFVGWSGGGNAQGPCTGSNRGCSFELQVHESVQATFAKK